MPQALPVFDVLCAHVCVFISKCSVRAEVLCLKLFVCLTYCVYRYMCESKCSVRAEGFVPHLVSTVMSACVLVGLI